MRRTTQTRIKRITAGVMTALLVLQMTPVAPFASIINAFAAEGDAADMQEAVDNNFLPTTNGNGFVTGGYFNNLDGGDGTFAQTITAGMLVGAKPEEPGTNTVDFDALAQAQAEKGVQAVAEDDAAGRADSYATPEKQTGWKSDADAKAEQQVKVAVANLNNDSDFKQVVIDALAEQLKGADPNLSDEDAKKEAEELLPSNANAITVETTLGEPTFSVSDVKVNKSSVDDGSVKADSNSVTWETPDLSLEGNETVTSNNTDAVAVSGPDNGAYTMTVKSNGAAELSIPYTSTWDTVGYTFSYAYSYTYSFNPKFDYQNNSVQLTWNDGQGSSHEVTLDNYALDPVVLDSEENAQGISVNNRGFGSLCDKGLA